MEPRHGFYDGEVKWIPVRAAARMLGVSRQQINKLRRTGKLVTLKYDSTVLVSLRSVEIRKAELERR